MNVLLKPYDAPPDPNGLRPRPETVRLAEAQVKALMQASPAFHALGKDQQDRLERDVTKIASYTAELLRDTWKQSQRIGETPMVKYRTQLTPLARAQTAGDEFRPAAAGEVARVTRETLRAVAFPEFVADLIRGTFNAIVQTSVQQMEAYAQLLANVGKTVDEFMQDNITDNMARDWLQQSYPEFVQVRREGDGARVAPRAGADERTPPNWQRDLNLTSGVSIDEDSFEETLVPAARRRLAESRLQLLSTLVLMGMNRIVVTGGKIRATMGFHIDTRDRLHQEQASDFDFRTGVAGSFGAGIWSVSASMSIAYVRSTRADSDAELNLETDLTGEVELHFKSDYFPLERFANSQAIDRIRGNTAVPEQNQPFSEAPAVGGEVGRYSSPRTRRTEVRPPTLRPIGTPLPEPRLPTPPLTEEQIAAPTVERRRRQLEESRRAEGEGEGAAPEESGAPAERPAATPAAAPRREGTAAREGESASPRAETSPEGTPAATRRAPAAEAPSEEAPAEGEGSAGGEEGAPEGEGGSEAPAARPSAETGAPSKSGAATGQPPATAQPRAEAERPRP